MVQGVINGNDVLFLVQNGTDYVPFVCAKDLSISTSATLVNITTKGDGHWDKFRGQSLNYTIALSGVMKFDSTLWAGFDFLKSQINFADVPYKAVFTSDTGQVKVIKGNCLVETSNISGNAGSLALCDFSLRGSGSYRLLECDTYVRTISVDTMPFDKLVTLSGITGTPTGFYWQLDSGDEHETADNPFAIGNIPGGAHTITVTPACADGGRGEETTYDFFFLITPGDDLMGVGEVTISLITSSSLRLSFDPLTDALFYVVNVLTVGTGANHDETFTTLPIDITGLLPDQDYQLTISVQYAAGISQGTSVIAHTLVNTDEPPQPSYDTTLAFLTDVTATASGITATVPATGGTQFSFNALPGAAGTTMTMHITQGTGQLMIVTFPAEYLTKSFKYKFPDGGSGGIGETVYGNFKNGTVNLS